MISQKIVQRELGRKGNVRFGSDVSKRKFADALKKFDTSISQTSYDIMPLFRTAKEFGIDDPLVINTLNEIKGLVNKAEEKLAKISPNLRELLN